MNWEAIGALAELVGAAGVISTLVYLAIQIRNSTVVDRANIRATLTEGSQNILTLVVADPELFLTYKKDKRPPDDIKIKILIYNYLMLIPQLMIILSIDHWRNTIPSVPFTLRQSPHGGSTAHRQGCTSNRTT